jgi:hypothetical protein
MSAGVVTELSDVKNGQLSLELWLDVIGCKLKATSPKVLKQGDIGHNSELRRWKDGQVQIDPLKPGGYYMYHHV